jgi:hypothetical protein
MYFATCDLTATQTMIWCNNQRQTILLYYMYSDIHTYSITHTVMTFMLYHLFQIMQWHKIYQ